MIKLYRKLPNLIRSTLQISEGWLVGGAIKDLLEDKEPKDYDIIVQDLRLYQVACANLKAQGAEIDLNSFGGLKFKLNDIEVDIWPEELSSFILTANSFTYAYNFRKNILIKNDK